MLTRTLNMVLHIYTPIHLLLFLSLHRAQTHTLTPMQTHSINTCFFAPHWQWSQSASTHVAWNRKTDFLIYFFSSWIVHINFEISVLLWVHMCVCVCHGSIQSNEKYMYYKCVHTYCIILLLLRIVFFFFLSLSAVEAPIHRIKYPIQPITHSIDIQILTLRMNCTYCTVYTHIECVVSVDWFT